MSVGGQPQPDLRSRLGHFLVEVCNTAKLKSVQHKLLVLVGTGTAKNKSYHNIIKYIANCISVK